MWDVSGAEEVVPDAERKAEVHSVSMVFREVASMVPDVHLGIVEEVFQRA